MSTFLNVKPSSRKRVLIAVLMERYCTNLVRCVSLGDPFFSGIEFTVKQLQKPLDIGIATLPCGSHDSISAGI